MSDWALVTSERRALVDLFAGRGRAPAVIEALVRAYIDRPPAALVAAYRCSQPGPGADRRGQ